ncbi:MAG: FkbM family methyltransferase [Microcoleus anatoxicus]|uniref:FkbM family methyltransferase n=1 Tax=Microcoleus anatoxicus TaxID=2705319 RepID=UPI00366C7EC9
MGIIRMGPPTEIIYKLKEVYGLNNFIETGTYQGYTAYWASQVFKQVFTIEYSPDIYQKVTEKYGHIKNIDFLYGDSRNLLQNTVSQLESPSLFWFDAHWSGGLTYGESDECPLLAEIEIINRSDCEHFIFIDDARLFLSPPPPPHLPQQWPDISAILNLLNSAKNSRHIVIIDDVIIAVPIRAKELIIQYCQDSIASLGNTDSGKQEENHQTAGVSVNNFNNGDSINNYELKIIENFIASGNVVFDIGANIGSWTNQVLNRYPDVQIHLFEPAPPIYQTLLQNLAEPIKSGQLVLNNLAIAHQQEIREFYYYEKSSGWSTFHRRFEIEKQYNIQSPHPFQVLTATLDDYVQTRGIKRINFLRIDTEGGELEVLHGATNLLQKGKVDYIQFEYGGTFVDAKITLKQVFEHLQKFRYTIFKILPNALQPLPEFSPEYENYEYSNFLAVNERFTALMFSEAPKLLDLQQLCVKDSVVPRGVIHIGAHEGKEIATYRAMGVQRVLFVEANPAVFERLQTNMAGFPDVLAVNCAISNINGTSTLYVTSMDQSSSILPLKEHQKIYPQIKEVERVVVESRTLDMLLEELQVNPADFNILNIDIQGAELLALQGATNVLKHIEAINTEVNYNELYEGCVLIDEIDEFLELWGFDRVATTTPFHPSWGDAFYVKKPAVTMSTLGRNGRFANQIFQYAFLKIYAKEHNLKVETPAWIGQALFGCKENQISQQLPVVSEETNNLLEARIPKTKEIFKNVDFWGYFQYNTKYYAPHKEYFKALFKPVPAIENKMKEALDCLRSRGKTIVGLHLRRGDYGYEDFFIAPSEWYREWLKGLWETLDEPILFIASDEPEKILSDFEEYNPVTAKDLGLELPEAEFYPDFYILSQCDLVAISNSSFSFAACMLNETGKFFFRPLLSAEKLIPFDPWNSEPILRNYMPIHFFTIVLNGEPFIRYHIEVLQQLPFKWHWHIIEGVADQKHDTAWMLSLGGKITDELHCRGRSKDGTSDYIDEIARLYPKNITVYRKPEGIFWDGKREMVNAPLENIKEECLLWQVDADELWTAEQICTARQMFINHPEKTAAFYWCWYFVGENLVISTRNCYAQNPAQEWLRTWRFKPGCVWIAHEPPRLAEPLSDRAWRDVAEVNPFLHEDTERKGLVFQHFAYATLEQLGFKEQYYGYKNAVAEWSKLQVETKFPVRLGDYLSWVQDGTMIDRAESFGVAPIARRDQDNNVWMFVQPEELLRQKVLPKVTPRIIVDGVFFQLYNTGIARVWRSLLEEWVTQDFAKHIIVLDRAGTAPKIPGITYCPVPAYDYEKTDSDREMLQQVCDELKADLFVSTYYTTPLSTASVFMAYDMTPEVFETNLDEPMWREKHYGIRHASAYITISHNTASDLLKFFPDIAPELVTVAHCGVSQKLSPASQEEIEHFKIKYNLSKPYFIMVGAAGGHKNAPLFLQAFAQLPNQPEFDIVCTFHSALTKDEFEPYTSGSTVHKLPLSDEELKAAFSGAVALVYPSQYEGFGLPILEAMACGCPVITCPNASIPEVAGEAALYVKDDDVEAMAIALVDIQKPEVREALIAAGVEQAKKFSWSKMAKTVSSVLIKVFQEKQSIQKIQETFPKNILKRDYVSQIFSIIQPDEYLDNMIVVYPNVNKGNPQDLHKGDMLRVDIGCGDRKPDNFVGVDVCPGLGVDIVADLNQRFPFPDNSVDELRAYDTIEHLVDRIHTMNEIWRICKDGAKVDILVPSTDGRGAFQDPTHVSFWNINSFLYYCIDFPNYIDLCRKYGFKGAFKAVRLEHEESPQNVIHVKAELIVVKNQNQVELSRVVEEKPAYIDPFLLTVDHYLEEHRTKLNEPDVIQNIGHYRKQIAERWIKLASDKLEESYLGYLGKTHRSLIECIVKNQTFTQEEETFIESISAQIRKGQHEPKAINYLLAAMLYRSADNLPLSHNLTPIPNWFINDYLKFILNYFPYFQELGEADSYYHYMQEWVDYIHLSIFANQDSLFWNNVAMSFLQLANFIPVYFSESNLKNIYVKRAEILEYVLKINGHEIDYMFFDSSEKYRKKRIGILASHFTPAAETFASLPVYEYLSRDFEVILYSLSNTGHRLEQYCQSCANSFKLLPNDLTDQVNFIRSDDLDILFFATNITAKTNQICLLSMHRLARVQVTSVSSVVTTGIRHMDYYISGKLTDWFDDAEQHYQEKLLKLEGSAHCFSYGSEQNTATIKVSREILGIAESAVVFICGANLFKITPELSNTWAKIIAGVPNSVLVLYPFGPNWSSSYPKEVFKTNLNKTFSQQGVELDRLLILDPDPIPNRDDIKEYLKLAEIYLDSYPFSGTTSVIDPLEVGLPVVAIQGTCFRSSMGAALIQELEMPDLVVSSEDSYIQMAIALGTNRELRQEKSEYIQQKMLSKPRFMDSRAYSAQMGVLFHELIRKYHIDALGNYLQLKDINLIIFPDWSQSEELISQDLASVIGAIVTHPDKSKMTLLLDSSNISEEDANLAISSVAMNLLMEQDLDVSDGPEISLVGELSDIQWEVLISCVHGRIILQNENRDAIARVQAQHIPTRQLDSLTIGNSSNEISSPS